jgi:hypothetical protein
MRMYQVAEACFIGSVRDRGLESPAFEIDSEEGFVFLEGGARGPRNEDLCKDMKRASMRDLFKWGELAPIESSPPEKGAGDCVVPVGIFNFRTPLSIRARSACLNLV